MKKDYVLSVDIGGSKIMTGIVDNEGQVVDRTKQLLFKGVTADEISEIMLRNIELLLQKQAELKIVSVGVSIPGLADRKEGTWIFSPFSGIKNLKIRDILAAKLRLPVFVENDVNACAYGEKVFGVCKAVDDFIWVTVSNGIGGGLFTNGKLYEGAFKNAGEIGHINVEENGPLCPCGNKGCLEACASGVAIAQRYLERMNQGAEGNITAKVVAERAKAGDEFAVQIYKETGYYLGKAISYAVNLLNPQKVILGGGVSMDTELFLPELERVLSERVFQAANKNLIVERTALVYDASLIGAAAIAFNEIEGVKYYE